MENIIFLKPNNLKDIIEDKDKGAFIITFDIKDIKLSIRFISKDIINISYYRDKLIKNVYVDVYEKNFNKDFKLKLIKKNGNYCISNGYLDVIIHCDPFFYQIAKSDEIVFKQAIDDKDITSKRYSDLFTFILNGNQIVAIKDSFYTGSYENFYGFGEKFSPLNKRGYNIEALNYDACGVASDKSYKNVPFFLNTKGYGILIDTTSKIKYNLATISFDSYSIEVEDSILDYYFFYGPSFKYILSNYIKLTGKLEDVPPKWSFGLWMSRYGYRSRKEIEMIGDELRKKEIPADVISLDPFWLRNGYYCDFVFDESKFPHPREMISSMRDKGFKLRIWIQPTVSIKTEMFKEGKEKGYLLKNINGDVYLWQNPISNEPEGFGSVDFSKIDISKLGIQPKAGIVDFTNPEAVSWFLSKLKYLIDWGVGIIMCDFGEDIPEDAYFFNGKTGKEMRNAYSYLYSGSVYNFMKKTRKEKPICEIRSGWAGMQKYAIHWSGDPKVSFDAMREVLRGGLSLALSGVFFWSHDIAGTAPTIPESELYIRWAQFGMFTSHARCHGMYPKEPWHYGKKAEEIFRRYDKLRYSLIPYIYSCAHHCIRENVPFIRPLV
ncbi:MAG: alpha-xylosidase, partial [Actinobacteria bacterium]|nr:alpha-xylosidase [Actinomycetota bacterium]